MIRNLAYIGFTSPTAEDWNSFGPDVLGAELVDARVDGAVRLRVDSAPWRIAVHPSESNDVAYFGWDAGGPDGFASMVDHVRTFGFTVCVEDQLAEERNVDRAAWFIDGIGFRHELIDGVNTTSSFTPSRPMSGFVTGDQGLGHVVLMVPDLEASLSFYRDVFGFGLSDVISGKIHFLHCATNAARHHTVALVGVRERVGLHHLMLEVGSIDDVGSALDIVNARELPLAMSLGRHTNDLMTSFYVRTPSGFEIEYGTGGLLVDDDTWDVGAFDAQSIWGHKPPSTPLFPGVLRPFTSTGASA